MKIKNIAAICKKKKVIAIFERHSESGDTVIQYIGDGGAAYPVTGLPQLEAESVLTIFDIINQQFVEGLQTLTRQCALSLELRKQEAEWAQAAAPEQCSMKVDPDTGKIISEGKATKNENRTS